MERRLQNYFLLLILFALLPLTGSAHHIYRQYLCSADKHVLTDGLDDGSIDFIRSSEPPHEVDVVKIRYLSVFFENLYHVSRSPHSPLASV